MVLFEKTIETFVDGVKKETVIRYKVLGTTVYKKREEGDITHHSTNYQFGQDVEQLRRLIEKEKRFSSVRVANSCQIH